MQHRYKVGQIVDVMTATRVGNRLPGPCKVLSLQPIEGAGPRYRVRPLNERNERVVDERDLRPSAVQDTTRTIAERQFKSIAVESRGRQ